VISLSLQVTTSKTAFGLNFAFIDPNFISMMYEARTAVILFDGVCNLCNSAVQFVIRRDKKNHFRFSSLQSPFGQSLLKSSNFDATHLNTFVLLQDGKIFTKSSAALLVARQLSGGWSLLYLFIIVPRFIRNGIYDWIARNRYRWFGKKEACMVPTAELQGRLIE
jgi:predicted DCC family thiol-disulfide oxidoreductase YuxK